MITISRYHAMLAPADTATKLPNNAIAVGSFLAVTAGTIALTTKSAVVKLAPFPVTAGQVVTLHMLCGEDAIFTTAGGASGTITYDS